MRFTLSHSHSLREFCLHKARHVENIFRTHWVAHSYFYRRTRVENMAEGNKNTGQTKATPTENSLPRGRVKFAVPELPLPGRRNSHEGVDLWAVGDLTFDDFGYGGAKSARAASQKPPPKREFDENYDGPYSARDLGMSRDFPGKIVKIRPKFPKPFNQEKVFKKMREDDKKNRVHPLFMSSQQEYDDPWQRELNRLKNARIRRVGAKAFSVTPHHRSVQLREQRQAQSNCTSHGPYMPLKVVSVTGKWEPYKRKHLWKGDAWKASLKIQRPSGM